MCSVPKCESCQGGDPLGVDYSGDVSVTVSGLTCQAWTATEPHRHGNANVGEHNYCRNPDGYSDGVWCYTTDPGKRWELCNVPKCEARHEGQEDKG